MRRIVCKDDARVGPWVSVRAGNAQWSPIGTVTVGLENEKGELVAGVVYRDYNGVNVLMDVASDGSKQWLCREFLWYAFYYPFFELKCKRVTGVVASNNFDAQRFDEALGFEREAVLKDADPDGDLIVYVMRRENCRWLNMRRARPKYLEAA